MDRFGTIYLEAIKAKLLVRRRIAANGCWEWTGAITGGYGTVRLPVKLDPSNRVVKVHRLSAALFLGVPLADEREIAHRCDNKRCFNPLHLFPASHAENMRDMADKGYMKGTANWRAKLNEEKIPVIRALLGIGITPASIGRLFGVSTAAICYIRDGKSWKHVMAEAA